MPDERNGKLTEVISLLAEDGDPALEGEFVGASEFESRSCQPTGPSCPLPHSKGTYPQEASTEQADRAKIFRSGSSQAVRLPKEYRFDGTEVRIRRRGPT
jgi:hypothetical protein